MKVRIEENGAVIVHEVPEGTPRIFADGFGPSLLGFPLTTVTLFQQELADPEDPTTVRRKVIMTVELPTTAILELAQTIQKTLRENKGAVEASMATMRAILDKDI
jgi:hypothetical protein